MNLTLAILMMLLLAACGNDNEIIPKSDGLEDTWKLISFEIDAQTTTVIAASGQTTVSNAEAYGENLTYEFTLDNGNWTTEGSYEMIVSATLDGMQVPSSIDRYDDITRSGTYSAVDSTIININGSFLEFEHDGVSYISLGSLQTADYTINTDDQLEISNSQNRFSYMPPGTFTSAVVYTSVWERK